MNTHVKQEIPDDNFWLKDFTDNYAWERVKEVRKILKQYRNNIKQLQQITYSITPLRGKRYTFKAVRYRRTAEDIVRTKQTIQHLKHQVALLERELEILMVFGFE